jgi:hypothetical protein
MVTACSRPQGRGGHRIRLIGRLRKFAVVAGASAAPEQFYIIVRVNRTLMTQIERIDADLSWFYPR